MRKEWKPDLETFSFGKKYDNAPFTKQRLKEAIYWEMKANGEMNVWTRMSGEEILPLLYKFLNGNYLRVKEAYTFFNVIPNLALLEFDARKDIAVFLKENKQKEIAKELEWKASWEPKKMAKIHKRLLMAYV